MLQNAYFLAKIGADTAENEQHSAEILPKAALLWAVSAPGFAVPGIRAGALVAGETRAGRAECRPGLAEAPLWKGVGGVEGSVKSTLKIKSKIKSKNKLKIQLKII